MCSLPTGKSISSAAHIGKLDALSARRREHLLGAARRLAIALPVGESICFQLPVGKLDALPVGESICFELPTGKLHALPVG